MVVTFVPLWSVIGEEELWSRLKTKTSTKNSNIVIFRLVFAFAAIKCIIIRIWQGWTIRSACLTWIFWTSFLPTTSGTFLRCVIWKLHFFRTVNTAVRLAQQCKISEFCESTLGSLEVDWMKQMPFSRSNTSNNQSGGSSSYNKNFQIVKKSDSIKPSKQKRNRTSLKYCIIEASRENIVMRDCKFCEV